MSGAVSVRRLGISYGSISVLRSLDLEVEEGEFLVLLGPSGCGKSTLLNAIAGLLDISEGQVWIKGRNVTWAEPKDRGIGMVFQSYALYPRMSVAKNLSFGLEIARVPKDEIAARIKFASELLHIEDLLKRKPVELSGGQRQRVAIGRALVRKVDVFLFDEPLSNLDAKLRAELRVELKKLHQTLGSTMIYVTHDQIEALTLADRIAVLNGGSIQQLDTPLNIYRKPANRFVAGFVGSPAMNFCKGALVSDGGAPAFAGQGLKISLTGYPFTSALEPGRAIELGIRPEHLTGLGWSGPVHEALVELVEPMGADTLAWCRVGEAPIAVRLDGESATARGQKLPIRFAPDRLSLFDAATGIRL